MVAVVQLDRPAGQFVGFIQQIPVLVRVFIFTARNGAEFARALGNGIVNCLQVSLAGRVKILPAGRVRNVLEHAFIDLAIVAQTDRENHDAV